MLAASCVCSTLHISKCSYSTGKLLGPGNACLRHKGSKKPSELTDQAFMESWFVQLAAGVWHFVKEFIEGKRFVRFQLWTTYDAGLELLHARMFLLAGPGHVHLPDALPQTDLEPHRAPFTRTLVYIFALFPIAGSTHQCCAWPQAKHLVRVFGTRRCPAR